MSDKTYMRNMRSFKDLLDTCARDFGDVHFMEYKTEGGVEAKTYIELKNCSDAVSRFLASHCEKNTHAALVGGASFDWVVAFLGIVDTGCAAVPLAPAETDEMNVKLVDFADCTVFFFDKKHRPLYEAIKKDVPSVTCFISLDNSAEPGENVKNIADIYTEYAGEYENDPPGDSLCAIMYTSGTTGFPKGVMLSHRNLS